MKLVPIHYKISQPVKVWDQIKTQAERLVEYIKTGEFTETPMAFSHCQVSEQPWAFFVANADLVKNGKLPHQIIVNAVIRKREGNEIPMLEGCMSFPFRKAKNVQRYPYVEVFYMIPDKPVPECFNVPCSFKVQAGEYDGVIAELFQHETDHSNGKNIYFDKPKE